jgi:hypothetical protein
MRRARSVSMCLAAVLAMSAVTAAAASATARPQFVFSGVGPPTSEEVSVKLHSVTTANFYYEGISTRLIECSVARGHGEILNSGGIARIDKLEMTFEECKLPGHSMCSINGSPTHGSIKTAVLESEFGYEPPVVTSEVLVNMVPNGGVFAEVEFSGTSCPLSPGTYQIKKGVISEIPSIDVNTTPSITSFLAELQLNGSDEQYHQEIEETPLTTTLDQLKIGTKGLGIEAELEFNLLSGSVKITT